MVDRFEAALPIDRVHDLLQPAPGLGAVEGAGQADIDVAGRVIRHDAEAFAARELRHRGGRPERKRCVLRFGKGRGRHLQREGGGLVERIDAASLDLARVRCLAGKMQLCAQKAAAADDDAVVARIAQRHRVGRPRDGTRDRRARRRSGRYAHRRRTARAPRRAGSAFRPAAARHARGWRRLISNWRRRGPAAAARARRRRKAARSIDRGRPPGRCRCRRRGRARGRAPRPAISTRTATSLPSPSFSRRGFRRFSAEPGMNQAEHRLRRIDSAAGRRRHQARRQLHDAVEGRGQGAD